MKQILLHHFIEEETQVRLSLRQCFLTSHTSQHIYTSYYRQKLLQFIREFSKFALSKINKLQLQIYILATNI